MREPRSRPAAARGSGGGDRLAALTPDEYAARLQEAARLLWTLAASVLGDRSQADDVLQEAALIGLRRLDQFQPDTSFAAWMGRIVRFVALNQVRLRSRRRTRTTEPEALDREPARISAPETGVGPRGEILEDRGEFDDDLARALGDLKPTARACLLLRSVLEMEYREIGETLGIPTGTAMSHVHRAREQLRRRLGEAPVPDSRESVRER